MPSPTLFYRRGLRLLERGTIPPSQLQFAAGWQCLRHFGGGGIGGGGIAAIPRGARRSLPARNGRGRFSAAAMSYDDASLPHCRTCTCTDVTNGKDKYNATESGNSRSNRPHHSMQAQQQSTSAFCHTSEPPIAPDTPLPPPLPKPNYSFHGRVMPSNLLPFNSKEGKERFGHALHTDHAEAYFPLSQQFINQSDPAYCGMTTLVLVLNALAMDPNVRWRGGWRWYGDEGMLLERCCLEEERVRREGVTMAQYCALARCQGVELSLKHPENGEQNASHADHGKIYGVEEFRRDIINAVRHPPHTHWDDVAEEEGAYAQNAPAEEQSKGGFFLVTSFARHALNQTGDGHFSPIAAYHPPTDSCLVLDVARFKYAPYWVSVQELYEAMKPPDRATGKSRGWILMYPPANNAKRDAGQDTTKHWTKGEMEGKRPAATVPEAGSGTSLCPVESIKIDFCSAGQR